MKDRTILELLEVLSDWLVSNGNIGTGLCRESSLILKTGAISEYEEGLIDDYIDEHMPKDYDYKWFGVNLFGWEPGAFQPRLDFLNERILIESKKLN